MDFLLKNLSLIADGLGFAVLAWKTVYDLWWNPRRFESEKGKGIEAAAKAKRRRADTTTWIAFAGLALSYLLMIIKDLQ